MLQVNSPHACSNNKIQAVCLFEVVIPCLLQLVMVLLWQRLCLMKFLVRLTSDALAHCVLLLLLFSIDLLHVCPELQLQHRDLTTKPAHKIDHLIVVSLLVAELP